MSDLFTNTLQHCAYALMKYEYSVKDSKMGICTYYWNVIY